MENMETGQVIDDVDVWVAMSPGCTAPPCTSAYEQCSQPWSAVDHLNPGSPLRCRCRHAKRPAPPETCSGAWQPACSSWLCPARSGTPEPAAEKTSFRTETEQLATEASPSQLAHVCQQRRTCKERLARGTARRVLDEAAPSCYPNVSRGASARDTGLAQPVQVLLNAAKQVRVYGVRSKRKAGGDLEGRLPVVGVVGLLEVGQGLLRAGLNAVARQVHGPQVEHGVRVAQQGARVKHVQRGLIVDRHVLAAVEHHPQRIVGCRRPLQLGLQPRQPRPQKQVELRHLLNGTQHHIVCNKRSAHMPLFFPSLDSVCRPVQGLCLLCNWG